MFSTIMDLRLETANDIFGVLPTVIDAACASTTARVSTAAGISHVVSLLLKDLLRVLLGFLRGVCRTISEHIWS